MSTYLERLATSARDPSTGIAPLVRPLYLAPTVEPEPAGSSLFRVEDEAAGAARRTDTEPERIARDPRPPAAPATSSFEPLLPEVRAPERAAPAARGASTAADAQAPRAPVDATEARPDGDAVFGARPDAVQVRQGLPGRLPRPSTERARIAPRVRLVEAPADIAPESRPALGRSPTGQRRPDEIRIHIGRVEVVAVAPSAPLPPPPRERKSLRLDDYLRDGG